MQSWSEAMRELHELGMYDEQYVSVEEIVEICKKVRKEICYEKSLKVVWPEWDM